MKPTEKSNSLPDLSLQFQTSLKLSSSVLNNTVKGLSINSVNTPDVPLTHHQDGFQVLLPINWPKNSKNQDSWSLLIQRATDKLSLKLHTLTSQPLLFATLMPHWTSLMLSSHVTTEFQRPLLWFSGCWPEKSWDSEVKFHSIKNGTKWLTCSLPEISKPSEVNKNNWEDNNKKLTELSQNTSKNKKLPKLEKKIGDLFELSIFPPIFKIKVQRLT